MITVMTALAMALAMQSPPFEEERPIRGDQVVLRALDKITARTEDLVVPIGDVRRFRTLSIEAVACEKAPPLAPPESKAYLRVRDMPAGRAETDDRGELVFAGWMFASDPAANAMEHAVYDVWPIACNASAPDNWSPAPSQRP